MAETTHAHFDWNTYIELCERLVARVAKSGWQFDSLLCLARGGMRPGDFFSRIYGKLLLVDDLCDSGETIRRVVQHLRKCYPEVTEIRVAVLWVKACSVFKPDYSVITFKDSPWIHQPFECYDDLGEEVHLKNCLEKYGDEL